MAIDTVQFCYGDGVSSPDEVCQSAQSLTYGPQGDPDIVWDTSPIESAVINNGGSALYNGIYFFGDTIYTGWTATEGAFYNHRATPRSVPAIGRTFTTGEFLVKYEMVSVVSGTEDIEVSENAGAYATGVPGTWYDLFETDISIPDDTTANGVAENQIIDVTLATDDGAGAPVSGTEVTKRIKIISYQGPAPASPTTSDDYIFYDTFSGGVLELPTHDSNWSAVTGVFSTNGFGSAKVTTAPAIVAVDAGTSDAAIYAQTSTPTNSSSVALIFRLQDSNNYWEFRIQGPRDDDPTGKLTKYESGVATDVATQEMTGQGPISLLKWFVICDGNNIRCSAKCTTWENGYCDLTTVDSYLASETEFGMYGFDTDPSWAFFSVSDVEVGIIDSTNPFT